MRSLFRRPGFAVAAILLVALGAGANAAVFSVVRGVLFRPLPYRQPERLVALRPGEFVSNRDIGYFRERTRSFEQIGAMSPGWMMALVPEGGDALKVTGARVSDNLFATLGVSAEIGRTIEPGDGPTRVALLAHSLWETRFLGARSVLGLTVLIDGQPHTVIGVMPRGFEIFEAGTDVWTPLPFDPAQPNHGATFSQAVGRLKAGVTPDAATRELAALAPRMRRDLALPNEWGRTFRVSPLQETVVGAVRAPLLILLGAAGLVLLLASVNLATLLMGRSVARAREWAVRSALGASPRRLLGQVLAEQAWLAVLGALAGLALAQALLPTLVARVPPEVPRLGEITLDRTVFLGVLTVAVGVALLASLVPAALGPRSSLSLLLRQSTSTAPGGRRRALGVLATAQIALALVLGIGAGLMLRSLWLLQQVDPGFATQNVLTFRLQTTSTHRSLDKGLPYFEQVVARVRALPGVISVGAIQHLPMTGYSWTTKTWREGRPPEPAAAPPAVPWRFVGWDYFQAMRIPLVHGRTFGTADRQGAVRVAIVNDAFARRFIGDPSTAVGQRLVVSSPGGQNAVEIVGVVGNVRHRALDHPPEPELYTPLAQTFMFPMAFVVRTAGSPAAVAGAVRQAAYGVDRTVPVAEMQPLATLLAESLGRPRLLAQLLSVFAAIGLLLGVVGVYGVVAHRVRQQERELGIRLAIGAAPRAVAALVVRQAMAIALAGVAVGLPLAFALAHVMRTQVFGIAPRDPFTFVALPALVLAAALVASYLPARRAARLDPAGTMRRE